VCSQDETQSLTVRGWGAPETPSTILRAQGMCLCPPAWPRAVDRRALQTQARCFVASILHPCFV